MPQPMIPVGRKRHDRLVGLLCLAAVLILLADSAPAGDNVSGQYTKDHRDFYEMGLVCRLNAQMQPDGRVKIVFIAANPALCGMMLEGEVRLKGQAGVFRDRSCLDVGPAEDCVALTLRFSKNKVTVTGDRDDGGPGGVNRCNLNGTYILFGAMVKTRDEVIKDIRSKYYKTKEVLDEFEVFQVEVDNLVLDAHGVKTDTSRLRVYEYHDSPKKIVVTHLGDKGKVIEEYYLYDRQLYFFFRQVVLFQDDGPATVKEDRFYFHQGRLIRWLDHDKKEVPPAHPRFQAEQERIVLLSARYTQISEMGEDRIDWNRLNDL